MYHMIIACFIHDVFSVENIYAHLLYNGLNNFAIYIITLGLYRSI